LYQKIRKMSFFESAFAHGADKNNKECHSLLRAQRSFSEVGSGIHFSGINPIFL
jgi:hypothetical protein